MLRAILRSPSHNSGGIAHTQKGDKIKGITAVARTKGGRALEKDAFLRGVARGGVFHSESMNRYIHARTVRGPQKTLLYQYFCVILVCK